MYTALENAVSVAGILLSTAVLLAELSASKSKGVAALPERASYPIARLRR